MLLLLLLVTMHRETFRLRPDNLLPAACAPWLLLLLLLLILLLLRIVLRAAQNQFSYVCTRELAFVCAGGEEEEEEEDDDDKGARK